MNITHPYIKYGLAITMVNNNLDDSSFITKENLKKEIERGINYFRVKPQNDNRNKTEIKYEFSNEEKGAPALGVYLSPFILSDDRGAVKVIKALKELSTKLNINKNSKIDITRSITPLSGEFGSFGRTIGRGKPKTDVCIAAYCAIATSTPFKPAMTYKTFNKGKFERENIAIIPDLDIMEIVDFINLFNKLKDSATQKLMMGNVKDGKPFRPKIFDGNFPYAPKTSALGSVALLGAIGNWGKEAKNIDWAKKVLDSFISRQIYLIGYKTFETFTYNHYIIDLAKEAKLSSIIDSIYYTILYNKGKRKSSPKKELDNRIEYQKFDLFASRFLQLFNRPAFKDFLAFRAEYPNQLESLFKTYFINMEKVNEKTVQSAHALGKWLNYAAYLVAKLDAADKGKEELRKAKAKALVEIESSIFSARSGDALIFQAVTRAGRLSNSDAPSESELFMTQTATGEISLETAKHLLIAFSRVMNKIERKENPPEIDEETVNDDAESDSDNISDAQE
ncbi:MAG: type I-PGING CRISPR-associated protein Cas8c/Csp2 [Sediminibacterium sp.]|nr:type I-PGING CRISPR-associated protein Cas8c/Csp2 [Sediminibacterium sp.]